MPVHQEIKEKNKQEINHFVSENLTKPLPIYSHATVYNGVAHISAVQGFLPGTFSFPEGNIAGEAEQMMMNLSVILRDINSEFDKLLKVSLYFINMKSDFETVNDIFNKYVPKNSPARSSLEVSCLPRGARVVIDCVAVVGNGNGI